MPTIDPRLAQLPTAVVPNQSSNDLADTKSPERTDRIDTDRINKVTAQAPSEGSITHRAASNDLQSAPSTEIRSPFITANRPFNREQFLKDTADPTTFTEGMQTLRNHLRLSTPAERQALIEDLRLEQDRLGVEDFKDRFHFHFADENAPLPGAIEFDSVFDSEEWSHVMVEGMRARPELITDKTVADVGCGNFCFGMHADYMGAKDAIGVDINPDAILNAQINQLVLLGAIKHPVNESDLLGHLMETGQQADTLVACIPQIVSEPQQVDVETLRHASLEARERVSHQTPPQGGVYAQFDPYGLGLIARFLDQAATVLNPGGNILLNIADRVDPKIFDALVAATGFTAEPVTTRTFAQQTTGDHQVDLSSFVNLEQAHGITFHFMDSPNAQQPISATQAQAMLDQGNPVYHSLTCYQLTPCTPVAVALKALQD